MWSGNKTHLLIDFKLNKLIGNTDKHYENLQGTKKDKTMAERLMSSLMMFHKITPSVDYNLWLEHLDTQLIEPTKQKSPRMLNNE